MTDVEAGCDIQVTAKVVKTTYRSRKHTVNVDERYVYIVQRDGTMVTINREEFRQIARDTIRHLNGEKLTPEETQHCPVTESCGT